MVAFFNINTALVWKIVSRSLFRFKKRTKRSCYNFLLAYTHQIGGGGTLSIAATALFVAIFQRLRLYQQLAQRHVLPEISF